MFPWRWRQNLLHRRHDCDHGIAAVEVNRVVPQVTPQSKKPSSSSTSKVVVRGHETDDLEAGRAVPVRQCRHALRHGVQRRKASAAAGVHAAGGEHPRPGVVRRLPGRLLQQLPDDLGDGGDALGVAGIPTGQPGRRVGGVRRAHGVDHAVDDLGVVVGVEEVLAGEAEAAGWVEHGAGTVAARPHTRRRCRRGRQWRSRRRGRARGRRQCPVRHRRSPWRSGLDLWWPCR